LYRLAVGPLVFARAVLYRFSVKSTCIVYLPLLWIIRNPPDESLYDQLSDITESEIERLKRWYSGFVIVF